MAALAGDVLEVIVDAVGNVEFLVLRPAVVALGELDFFLAERLAVGRAGVLLVRRAIGDVAVHDDECRAVGGLLEDVQGAFEHFKVVRVADARHIPAVTDETGGDILAERQLGVAFDRNLVVVVNPAEIGKLQMSRERGRFAGNAFHHVAVAARGVHVVVEHFKIGAVEVRRHPPACHRHADAHGETVPERAGGCVDSRTPAVFRMAWRTCC